MKKRKTIFLILFVVLACIAVCWLPITMAIHSWFFVEEPDFTYGEFSIQLTYELNGEAIIVDDIYVVEYSRHNPMTGYSWSGHIKSTDEDGIIIYEEENLKIICELGDETYYTGEYKKTLEPFVYLQKEERHFLFFKKEDIVVLSENVLFEQYGIKLVSWTAADPLDVYWKAYE